MTSDEYKTVIDTTHMMLGGYGRAIHPDDKKRLSDALAILEKAHKAAAPQAGDDLAIAVERAALYAASLKKADAENDALRADAARYQWLRDKSEPGICAFYMPVGMAFHSVKFKRETVDEAIDAVRKAEGVNHG